MEKKEKKRQTISKLKGNPLKKKVHNFSSEVSCIVTKEFLF